MADLQQLEESIVGLSLLDAAALVRSWKSVLACRMVSASADPVIEIENQKYNPAPEASLTGQVSNQSGQTVNVAHVLSTFYDKNGQLVWVAGNEVRLAHSCRRPPPISVFRFLKISLRKSAVNEPWWPAYRTGRFSEA